VTFWNEQLMPILGFTSWSQLDKARDKAIAGGWLHYESGGKRKVGRYWSMIPVDLCDIPDSDSSCDYQTSIVETNDKAVTISGQSADNPKGQVRIKCGQSEGTSGEHSTLDLIPSPTPNPNSTHPPSRLIAVEVTEAIKTWHEYWRTSHGCGRPDSEVRVDAMLAKAMSAGWLPDKIAK
jgi:hypothetical protein